MVASDMAGAVSLQRGRLQVGTWINLVRNSAVLPLLQTAGLDFARVDMEHSAPSIETVATMATVARALRFPLVVRPPTASREWLTRLLDIGVTGLHVPQVDTPEIAREIVRATRYAPVGMRGMAGSGPHNDFRPSTPRAELDALVHVTVMLESPLAFSHLDEIVSTEGIDAVTLGPADLAQELGVLGTPDENRVIDEHRLALIDAATRHGKDVALLCSTVEEARRWIDAGVSIIAFGSDVSLLQHAAANAIRAIRA